MVRGKSTLPETRFSIVGIGASAGGLEALELFSNNMKNLLDSRLVGRAS
jgi:chemotaxis response regulator CheB